MEIPRNNEDYRTLEYWDKRYEEEESYEWFMGYGAIRHLMNRDIKTSDTILTLGSEYPLNLLYMNHKTGDLETWFASLDSCGNSPLSEQMYQDGFQHITNTDFSPTVIEKMREKYLEFPNMTWRVLDIRDLSILPSPFDIILEKGTLDSLLVHEKDPWNVSTESLDQIDKILEQVSDRLKPDGKFISITFAQPHFRRPLYARSKYKWSVEVKSFGISFHFFYYVMTNGQSLSQNDKDAEERRNMESLRTLERSQAPLIFLKPDTEDFLLNIQV